MPRKFNGDRIVIASHNKGKIIELGALLREYVSVVQSAHDLDLPEPEETGQTFEENAELKARAGAAACGQVVLADDSGLCVTALDGAPGLYSARWADGGRDYPKAWVRIWEEMADNPDHSAKFVTAITLGWPDGHVETVTGETQGKIIREPRGEGGFGYDPIFIPDGYDQTFSEIDMTEHKDLKARIRALNLILEKCFL